MEQTAVSGNLDNMAMKGLEEAERGLTIEKNQWPADIDEAGNRYVEFVIGGAEKTLLVQQISFVLEGKICYRIAYARGKDFYPWTDMGERQQATDSTDKVVLPVNETLNPGERLHIRLFPWSTKADKDLYFKIKEGTFTGVEIE